MTLKNKFFIFVLIITGLFLFTIGCTPEPPDTSPPIVKITSHSDGDYVKGDIVLAGTASDNAAMSKVMVSFDSGANYENAIGTGNWEYNIDTTEYSDGAINLMIKGLDTSGLSDFKFITLIIDNNAPDDLNITSPDDGDSVNGMVTITGTTSDALAVEKVEIKIGSDDFVLTNGTTSWNYTFDTSSYSSGDIVITAKATDISGNYSTHTITITIDQDSDKPTISIMNPSEGDTLSGWASIAGIAEDDDGIGSVELNIDGGTWETLSGKDIWSKLWNTTSVTVGSHTINLRATDVNGVVSDVYSVNINVQQLSTTPPALTIDSHSNGQYIKGSSVIITGTASDDDTVSGIQISFDAGSTFIDVGSITDNGDSTYDWSHTINTTLLTDGNISIAVKAFDNAGLENYQFVTLIVDNTIPNLNILNPSTGTSVNGNVTITGTSLDNLSVQTVEIQIGTGSFESATGTNTWNYSFDSTDAAYTEGNTYTVTARATDYAGNIKTDTIDITINQASDKPTVTVIAPTESQTVKGLISIMGTANDDDGLLKVQVSTDGGSTYNDANGTNTWNYTWNTDAETVGNYVIKVKAIDINSLEGDPATVNVEVDRSIPPLPTIAINSHSNGEYINGTISVTGTASDANALSNVYISLDAGTTFNSVTGLTSWSYSLNTTSLSDGNISVAVKAVNASGLEAYQFVTLIVDNTNPTNSIVTPANNTSVNGNVTITGTAIDNISIEKVEVKVGTGSFQNATGTNIWNYTFDSTSYTTGTYTITSRATDYAGNYIEDTISLIIDQSSDAPTVSILNPSSGSDVSGTLSIVGTSLDDDGVQNVKISFDGGTYSTVSGTSTWNKTWDTTSLSDGNHTIYVKATDINDLEGSPVSITVNVDNSIPSMPEVSISTPIDGSNVSGTISITGTASDANTLTAVDIKIGTSGTFTSVTGLQNWSYSLNTTSLTDGNISIAVRATNNSGLTNYEYITLIVDNTNPAINITSPSDGSSVNGLVTIGGNASDNISIEKVEVKVGSESYQAATGTNTWTYSFNSTSYTSGSYVITARVTDTTGNTATDTLNISINQDSDKPTATIINPTSGQIIKGIISIGGTASDDDGVSKVEVSTDDGITWVTATGTTTWNYSWDTSSFGEGDHVVKVRSTDTNTPGVVSDIVSVTVTVNNSIANPPQVNISSHTDGEYIKGTVVLSGTASDDSSVDTVQISFDAGTTFTAVDSLTDNGDGTYNWSYSKNTTTLSNGNISLSVKATNDSALSNYQFVTLIVDNQNPALSITSHSNGDKINDTTLLIAGTSSDNLSVQKVEIYVDSIYKGDASGTNNWTYNLNTSGISDLTTFSLKAKVLDYAGNYIESTINLEKDMSTDKPTLVFINPVEAQKISGIVSIAGTATDDDGIDYVELKIDSGSYETITGTNVWSKVWHTTDTTEGAHTLTVRATDINGLTGDEVTINIVVDQTIPSLSITSPATGSYIKGSILLSGIASDNNGINKIELSLNGGTTYFEVNTLTDNGNLTYNWSHTIDTTTLSDGAITIYARAVDITGLLGVTSTVLTIDNTDPVISISTPTANEMLSGIVSITGTSSDTVGVNKVEINIGALPPATADGTSNWNYDFNTAILLNGYYTILTTVTDFAGNTSTDTQDVIFDQNLPEVNSINISDGDNLKGSASINGTVYDEDNGDLSSVEISVDGGAYVNVNTFTPVDANNGNWSHSLDTTGYSNGVHSVNIKVTDSVSGSSILTKNVIFDNLNPSIAISDPYNGNQVGVSVLVTGTASDSNSGVQSIIIKIDDLNDGSNELVTDITSNLLNGYWSYQWDTTSFTLDENQKIEIEVTDKAGNVNTDSILVMRTSAVPSVSITSHSNGDFVRSTILLTGTSSSPTGTVTDMEVQIDSGSFNTVTNTGSNWSTWEYSINTTSLSDGLHVIKARAIDNLAVTTTIGINITVDNTPPVVNITYPTSANIISNNQALYGDIEVTGTAFDTNLDIVEVKFEDSGSYVTANGTTAFSYDWNTATIDNVADTGVNVYARASDLAGNITIVNVTVDVRPHITELSTTAAERGEIISIYGYNFSPAATVTFDIDGTNRTTSSNVTYVSSTQLQAEIPNNATSGDVIVSILSSDTLTNIDSNGVWINIWSVETIPNTSGATYSAITINDSYYTFNSFVLGGVQKEMNYAGFNGTSWSSIKELDNIPNGKGVSAQFTDIANSGTYVYVVYYWAEEGEVKYAISSNSGGSFTNGVTLQADTHYPSVAAEGSNVYISFYDKLSGDLKMAKSTNNGGSFVIETIDSNGNVGGYTSITFDSSNNPVISYYDYDYKNLKYAYWNGSSWNVNNIDTGIAVGQYSSIAVGTDGSVHVSYYDGNTGDLKYAKSSSLGGAFTIESPDYEGITGWYTSISLDTNNLPHISYYDFTYNAIKYIHYDGSEWETILLPGEGTAIMSSTSIYMYYDTVNSVDLVNIGYAAQDGIKLSRYLP